jgi:hypothetical protein
VGLLALAHRHTAVALEHACERAVGHGVFKLRVVRELLKRQGAPAQTEMEFLAEHPLIRNLTAYGTLVRVSFHEERPWPEPPVNPPQEEQRPATTTSS